MEKQYTIFRKKQTRAGLTLLLYSQLSKIKIRFKSITPKSAFYDYFIPKKYQLMFQTSQGEKIYDQSAILRYLLVQHGLLQIKTTNDFKDFRSILQKYKKNQRFMECLQQIKLYLMNYFSFQEQNIAHGLQLNNEKFRINIIFQELDTWYKQIELSLSDKKQQSQLQTLQKLLFQEINDDWDVFANNIVIFQRDKTLRLLFLIAPKQAISFGIDELLMDKQFKTFIKINNKKIQVEQIQNYPLGTEKSLYYSLVRLKNKIENKKYFSLALDKGNQEQLLIDKVKDYYFTLKKLERVFPIFSQKNGIYAIVGAKNQDKKRYYLTQYPQPVQIIIKNSMCLKNIGVITFKSDNYQAKSQGFLISENFVITLGNKQWFLYPKTFTLNKQDYNLVHKEYYCYDQQKRQCLMLLKIQPTKQNKKDKVKNYSYFHIGFNFKGKKSLFVSCKQLAKSNYKYFVQFEVQNQNIIIFTDQSTRPLLGGSPLFIQVQNKLIVIGLHKINLTILQGIMNGILFKNQIQDELRKIGKSFLELKQCIGQLGQQDDTFTQISQLGQQQNISNNTIQSTIGQQSQNILGNESQQITNAFKKKFDNLKKNNDCKGIVNYLQNKYVDKYGYFKPIVKQIITKYQDLLYQAGKYKNKTLQIEYKQYSMAKLDQYCNFQLLKLFPFIFKKKEYLQLVKIYIYDNICKIFQKDKQKYSKIIIKAFKNEIQYQKQLKPITEQYYIIVKDDYFERLHKQIKKYSNYIDVKIKKKSQKFILSKLYRIYNANRYFTCFSTYPANNSGYQQIDILKKTLSDQKYTQNNKKTKERYLEKAYGQNQFCPIKLLKSTQIGFENIYDQFKIQFGSKYFSVQKFAKLHKFPDIKNYQWLHLRARCLGGRLELDNGIIGHKGFNSVMNIYEKWVKSLWRYRKNKELIYYVQANNFVQYRQNWQYNNLFANHKIYDFGLCCSNVVIRIIIDKIQVLNKKFNPFDQNQSLKIQQQFLDICFNIQRFNQYYQLQKQINQSQKDINQLNSKPNEEKGGISWAQWKLGCLQRKGKFDQLKSFIIKKSLSFQEIMKKFVIQSIGLEIIYKQTINSQQEYLMVVQKVNLNLLQKLLGVDSLKLPQSISKIFDLKEINVKLSDKYLGVQLGISIQIKLQQSISQILQSIFKFENQPELLVGGSILFASDFFVKPSPPSYFSLWAKLQNKQNFDLKIQKNSEMDINYRFLSAQLRFNFSYKQNQYDFGWQIKANFTIFNLAQSQIQFECSFKSDNNKKLLRGQVNKPIKGLFFQSLQVDRMKIQIQFISKSFSCQFQLKINDVIIYFKGQITSQSIKINAFVSKLTLNDLLSIVKKFTDYTFQSNYKEIVFQLISLQISWKRANKGGMSLTFQCQITVDKSKFEGQVEYKDSKLTLTGSAQTITFTVLNNDLQIKKPKVVLDLSSNQSGILYTGTLVYKPPGQSGFQVQTTVGIQYMNTFQYLVQANLKTQNVDTMEQIKCVSCLKTIGMESLAFRLKSNGYQMTGGELKPNKFIQVKFSPFKLFQQNVNLSATINFDESLLEGSFKFLEQSDDPNALFRLQKLSLKCKLLDPSITIELTVESPRYKLKFSGGLIVSTSGIGISLKMYGVIGFLSNTVELGYSQPEKYSELTFTYGGVVFDFAFKGRIKIKQLVAQGAVTIKKNVPTFISFTITNLDLGKLFNSICGLFKDKNQDKTQIKSFETSDFLVKKLHFEYDISNFVISGNLDLQFCRNELVLQLIVNSKQIKIYGSFKRPVKIGPLILSAKSSINKGAIVDIEINSNPRLNIDCNLEVGPLTAGVLVQYSSEKFKFDLEINLFGLTIKLKAQIQFKKIYGKIQFKYNKKQGTSILGQIVKFIKNILVGQKKAEKILQADQDQDNQQFFSKFFQIKSQTQKCLRQSESISEQRYSKRKQLINRIFLDKEEEKYKKLTQHLQKRIKQQINLQKIQQKEKNQLLQMKNFSKHINYRKQQNQLRKKDKKLQKKPYQAQMLKLDQQFLQNQQENLIKQNLSLRYKRQDQRKLIRENLYRQKFQQKQLNQQFQQYQLQEPYLQGWLDDIYNWAKNALKAAAQKAQKLIDDLIPSLQLFEVEATVGDKKSWLNNISFTVKIEYIVLKKLYKKQFQWGGNNPKQMEAKMIFLMVNSTIQLVRIVYVIPKYIYEPYEKQTNDTKFFQDLKKGKVQGLLIWPSRWKGNFYSGTFGVPQNYNNPLTFQIKIGQCEPIEFYKANGPDKLSFGKRAKLNLDSIPFQLDKDFFKLLFSVTPQKISNVQQLRKQKQFFSAPHQLQNDKNSVYPKFINDIFGQLKKRLSKLPIYEFTVEKSNETQYVKYKEQEGYYMAVVIPQNDRVLKPAVVFCKVDKEKQKDIEIEWKEIVIKPKIDIKVIKEEMEELKEEIK